MPRCPVCMVKTDMIKYEGVPVYNCGSCGGHWVTASRLDVILARREIVMPDPVKVKMISIADEADSKDTLWCWSCGKEMEKSQFKFWPDIQIDHCPKCHGIWLDRGELEKCQIYWEYMKDHPDSQQAKDARRIADLQARWATRKRRLGEKVEGVADGLSSAARYGVGGLSNPWAAEGLPDLFALDKGLDPGPLIPE